MASATTKTSPRERAIRRILESTWLARVVLASFLLAGATNVPAQDLERERRLGEQFVDAIMDGDPLTLDAGKHEFLAIYTEAEQAPARGGAIILHGRGFHPNWAQVVYPLRTTLPGHGWHTLSLQMPVLHKDAKYYDYVPIFPAAFPRIKAGIEFFRERKISPVVIIAHSCSVHMTMAYFEAFGDSEFDAYIGIGMGATDRGQPMRKPFPLERMSVPVLDLYGSDEYPAVLRMAPERAAAIRAGGHPLSSQVVVNGADHYFDDKDDEVNAAVLEWLETFRP